MDIYDQVIFTDSQSEGTVEAVGLGVILSGNTKVTALNGKFTFNNLILSAEPGSRRMIRVTSPIIIENEEDHDHENSS